MKIKNIIYYLSIFGLFAQCQNNIKDENASVIQETGTETSSNTETVNETKSLVSNSTETKTLESDPEETYVMSENSLHGYWVGYFKKDVDEKEDQSKNVYVDEGFMWARENKINISIDKIEEGKVKGHSVVAGNRRPFSGTMKNENNVYYFEVKEPGDNKYDGVFTFQVKGALLEGTWKAFKKIDISKRKYKLQQKEFKYDPDIMLEAGRFINWEKSKIGDTLDYGEGDYGIAKEFSTATDQIYKINASNTLLTKMDVENLKKGDLLIIRNTIYARHGYSFKNRPLRVFFDSQNWYIPVFANIKNEFTDIEKKNIELLLRYEKNAKEYYDRFGRG